ncbi:MAG: methyltransferase [Candidatus Woesearchaeota archaeon]
MKYNMEIYTPAEDSLLLKSAVEELAFGRVLDMGTGTGILAEAALKRAESVLGVDINPSAVEYCRQKYISNRISFVESDLFENITGSFDCIIFNPPYLPTPKNMRASDVALDGGKKGYEVIDRFLSEAGRHLNPSGIILLLFSSITGKRKVDECISNYAFDYVEIKRSPLFFEEIFVYKITKSKFLVEMESNGIDNIKFFAKGKRGIIYTGKIGSEKVAIKIKNPSSKAMCSIANEGRMLKELNKYNIGPRLIMAKDDFIVYDFIDGCFFEDFVKKSDKDLILRVLDSVVAQLRKMDSIRINKAEMSHPRKHILVEEKTLKVTLIDFERSRKAEKTHNLTQFAQYLRRIMPVFYAKGISSRFIEELLKNNS